MKDEKLVRILKDSILEDIPNKDITTELMVKEGNSITANLISKETGVFYGEEIIDTIFKILDKKVKINLYKKDGDQVNRNEKICKLAGEAKNILMAERVMLNFLQRLSGVATITNKMVKKLNNPKITILDTRKTTPLMRFLEKKAVLAGGGGNHRQGLSDMVLIKENHLASFLKRKSVEDLSKFFEEFKKTNPNIKIEIEIETLEQLQTYDLRVVDYIMFDHFDIPKIQQGVKICKERGFKAEIEISGNITMDNIELYRDLDINRISVGSLTHSVKALDLSLRFD